MMYSSELPKCPRCDSSNTKFCYYNNYSLSQPRFICKSCRRYWTRGGNLRNVPLGRRKIRRSRSRSLAPPRSEPSPIQDPPVDSDSPGIDLAAVFKSFLNPEPNRVDPVASIEERPLSGISSNTFSAEKNQVFESRDFLGDHDVFWSDVSSVIGNIWGSFDFSGFEVFSTS